MFDFWYDIEYYQGYKYLNMSYETINYLLSNSYMTAAYEQPLTQKV